MRWMAVVVAALVLAAPAAGGGSVVKVPGPAAGKIRVELVTIKASSTPKLTVTNLSALGSGFHGAYVVGTKKSAPGKYFAYLVMFNTGTSSVASVNVQLSTGTPTGSPADDTKSCSALDAILGYNDSLLDALAYGPLKKGDSPPKTEVKNDVQYQAKSVPCT